MGGKTALIAGASGLVGGELLHYLLNGNQYDKVVALARRPLGIKHPKLEEIIADFENLFNYKDHFRVDDVFCCLGTTIKKAKSREAMLRVDVDYPLIIARVAKEMGAKQFLVISSIGANPNSFIWYTRMKGLLEEQLKEVGFRSLHILRPSLLLGKRTEFRLDETVGAFLSAKLSFAFIGPLKKYKAISGKTVALGMYKIAQSDKKGVNVYISNEIETIAKTQ
ncbi:putative nucleoside-diphosphate-sugar epimerase [Bacillus methanolicus PB1]|uniref:Putative nucleoside-diphosphate-sugar epimerase n=1 Tax=Bacillus methanolicus PB1 TaxID=997296 RepID=I3E130_BACMT|nr:oxidoreductase [Bacillus methanolicus]EIJ80201.1 putative nucleoside-diphosphate-sugar epimerase [Bacillus methanolicus PB1]